MTKKEIKQTVNVIISSKRLDKEKLEGIMYVFDLAITDAKLTERINFLEASERTDVKEENTRTTSDKEEIIENNTETEKESNERKERWMKQTAFNSQLLSSNIIPMNPEIGFYMEVNGLEISEDFFEKEYDQIVKAYYSVMKQLEEYYKTNITATQWKTNKN